MMQGFWWSVITMTGVGYGDKTTKGPFGRIMAVLWIMISTIFVSLFTANASSILAISQAEEDHSITLGKKIGSFNSKHFFEDQLNLGGQMINHPTGMSMRLSILNGDTDRAIFPNYLDFIHALTLPEFSSMKDVYQISNTFDYPFQIGMAFAVDPNNMTSSELGLLTCLRSSLPPLELLLRRQINVVGLHDESISKKKKVPLDSNTILTLSYWCFLIIACLVAFGLSYDYWNYRRRNHTSEHHIGDIEESVIEGTNDEINVQQPDVENQENVQPDVENQENVQPDVENQENVQLYCAESSQSVKQEAVDCCENNVTVNDETDVPQDSNYSLHE
ncbi:uncharacterized protein LOC124434354 isoform X2 [Xenia sp. Carnegie-2017]|uniref:uncharacterized protein LOC124434354 isoform X2 n=1 Tax=Xenia sp. Carnegie-2017 TaxID=2897299 RepID=UPI001F04F709|nr:uncharacterized protein LOC124434354 isoform X2 [Xenia sp. Carnegie-2017]